jgi:coenzyme PQQ synthesis protein D (PqqD)
MAISFASKVSVPDDVLVSQLQDESVLLNVRTQSYFGLDQISTRCWELLTSSDSIEDACAALAQEYDVDADTLRQDVARLVDTLVERGLLQVSSP